MLPLINPSSLKLFRLYNKNNIRIVFLSTKIQLTPEEIKKEIEKIEKYKKIVSKTVSPKSLTQVLGTGSDLHIPANIAELAALSGMPAEQANRTVVIGQRMNKTLQSGDAFAHQWQIKWKHQEKWKNPLMGWTSTADPMAALKLNFDTQEDAVAFANRNGWKYELQLPTSKSNRPQGYTLYKHNFLDKRTTAQLAKEGCKTKIFFNPKYGQSNFFMPLKYHGDGEVLQHGPSLMSKP